MKTAVPESYMLKRTEPVYRQNNQYPLSQADRENSGRLLRQLREDSGISLQAFAEALAVNESTLEKWEGGLHSINPCKLGDIVRTLQEYSAQNTGTLLRFCKCAHPYMGAQKGWLETKLKECNYEHLNFPALDLKWLRTQPEEVYLPWLIAAYRMKSEITQQELGEKTGRKQEVISVAEKGIYTIRAATLMEKLDALHLGEADKRVILEKRFLGMTRDENGEEKIGRLLRFYRELLGHTIEEMANGTGIGRKIIMSMEAGTREIDKSSEAKFISYFYSLQETKTGILFDRKAEKHFAKTCKAVRVGEGMTNATSHFGCIMPSSQLSEREHSTRR